MSILKKEDEKRWIGAFIAVSAIIVAYLMTKLLTSVGDTYGLESTFGATSAFGGKTSLYPLFAKGISVVAGTIFFLIAIKANSVVTYLSEVFTELVKVIWPNPDTVSKLSLGILIAIAIVSTILLMIDKVIHLLVKSIY